MPLANEQNKQRVQKQKPKHIQLSVNLQAVNSDPVL